MTQDFSDPAAFAEPPLSNEQLTALRQCCAPATGAVYPPVETIRVLRQHGYVEIVLGGLQTTDKGMERLIRERTARLQRRPRQAKQTGLPTAAGKPANTLASPARLVGSI